MEVIAQLMSTKITLRILPPLQQFSTIVAALDRNTTPPPVKSDGVPLQRSRSPEVDIFWLCGLDNMRTSVVAGAVTALTTLHASAFTIRAGSSRVALQATAHHGFCSGSSASSVFSRATLLRPLARRSKRPRAGGSARQSSSASLSMFDATDLFQLQQWAGDVSATEVCNNSSVDFTYKFFSGPRAGCSYAGTCLIYVLPRRERSVMFTVTNSHTAA